MNIFRINKKGLLRQLLIITFISNIFFVGCASEKTINSPPITSETMEQFKSQCNQLDYAQLVRNPDNYKERRIIYIGKVVQTQEDGNNVILRVNVSKGNLDIGDDIIWVNYTKPAGSNRILEEDVIQLWGTVIGLRQYKAVMGNQIAIPEINAKYIEIYNDKVVTANNRQSANMGNQFNNDSEFVDIKPQGDTKGAWARIKNSPNELVRIWNPQPAEGETVEWIGGKINRQDLVGKEPEEGYPIYYVHGNGKAVWYVNGVFEQSDEGYFHGGKRHGTITQKFADGRVIVSEWNHGIKIR